MIQTGDNVYALFSRYARTSKTTTTTNPPPGHVAPTNESPASGTTNAPSETPPQPWESLVKRIERDNLKCNLCPMVFVDKADIARHMTSSHATTAAAADDKSSAKKATTKSCGRRSVKTARIESPNDDCDQWPEVASASTSASSSSMAVHRCKVCLKVCLSFRGLTRHSAIHRNAGLVAVHKAPAVKVECGFCQQTFGNDEDKRKHVSSYHRIMMPSEGTDENGASKSNVGSFVPNTMCEVTVKVDDEKENIKNDLDEKNVAGGGDKGNDDDVKKADQAVKKPSRKRPKKSEPSTKGEFACDECDKTFEKKSSYVRHKHTHSSAGNEFPCDVCQKQFSSEMVLKRHKSNVHRTKRGKLSEEEDPFSKWYVFADGQKHLKCDQCKYNSLWYHKGRFLEHYRIHTGEKPFTCDLCGKQFRTKTLLQKHVMFVHEGIKEHPCDLCGRCFSDKRYMEDHRRIHTGERPYVCDLCGKTFKQSASLFIHKELHKGLRKHSCEMCGKRFTTRSSLTIHIKRHVGERNFICATCGKAFVDGKHLKDHMAVHSEERPFACELCGGRFKLMKHLKQHGRTHKREYAAA